MCSQTYISGYRVLRYEEAHELKKRIEELENEITRKEKNYEEYKLQVKIHEEARDKLRVELNDANQKVKESDNLSSLARKELNELQARLSNETLERVSLSKQYDELREQFAASEKEKLELQLKVSASEDLIFKSDTMKETLQHDLFEVGCFALYVF